jgi:hypothetical protein
VWFRGDPLPNAGSFDQFSVLCFLGVLMFSSAIGSSPLLSRFSGTSLLTLSFVFCAFQLSDGLFEEVHRESSAKPQ